MLARSLWLVGLVGFVCSGCGGGRFSFGYHDHRPVRVTRVHRHTRHVCTHDCHNHYWDGTDVLVISDHRHGRDCGHWWDGAHWVLVGKRKAARVHPQPAKVTRIRHVHDASCGCVYDRRGHKWAVIRKGHVHRRGCGHVLIEGRWSLRR